MTPLVGGYKSIVNIEDWSCEHRILKEVGARGKGMYVVRG